MQGNIIRILVTDLGHPACVSALESLRRVKENIYHIVGVAQTGEAVGFAWCDAWYRVPSPERNEYIPELLRICGLENIDLVIPWTDEEAREVAKAAPIFKAAGIEISGSAFEKITRCIDKGLLYQDLKKLGIPVPNFELISNLEDLEAGFKRLGGPEKTLVIKPRLSSEGEGLWIIDQGAGLFQKNGLKRQTLEGIKGLLKNSGEISPSNQGYLLMEFLPGDDFSVDLLAREGETIFAVSRLRTQSAGGVASEGEIVYNTEVLNLAGEIVKGLGLHLNLNLQFKYSEGPISRPFIYDLNPRISGTIVANALAGVNLLHYGIRLALDLPIPSARDLQINNISFKRYYQERVISGNKFFEPI